MDQFDVYVAGFEVDEARATRGMMQAFGLGEGAARIFVQSVPRMAKRRVTREAAERYAQALRAIGAVVDCQPSQPSGYPSSGRPSLPAPAPSTLPAQQREPWNVGTSRSSLPAAPMPSIPRAPRLPQGLSPRPASSDYPADLAQVTAPSLELIGMGYQRDLRSSPLPLRDHASMRPENIGLSHSFTPIRPGSSIAPPGTSFAAPPPPWYANRSNRWLAICVVVGLASYAYSMGVFRSRTSALDASFRGAGIAAGNYDEVRHFLAQIGSSFEALPSDRLSELLEGLERAGAKRVWAIEIEQRGSARVSRALLVELPSDAAGRRTIFFQLAHNATDTGQAFLRIAF